MWGACRRFFTVKRFVHPCLMDSFYFFCKSLSFGGGRTSIFLTFASHLSYSIISVYSYLSVGSLSLETNALVTSIAMSRCTTFSLPNVEDSTRTVESAQWNWIQSTTRVIKVTTTKVVLLGYGEWLFVYDLQNTNAASRECCNTGVIQLGRRDTTTISHIW